MSSDLRAAITLALRPHRMWPPSHDDLRWTCSAENCDWTASDTFSIDVRRMDSFNDHLADAVVAVVQEEIDMLTIQKRTAEDAVVKFAHQRDEARAERDQARKEFASAHDDRVKWQTEWERLLDSSCLQGIVGHRLCDCIAPSEQRLRTGIKALADKWENDHDNADDCETCWLIQELRALLDRGVAGGDD